MIFQTFKFELSNLLPKTKREWIKFIFDLILLAFFLYFIINTSLAYREGFELGKEACLSEIISKNITIKIP